jgi:hypothetical protein
MEIPDSYYDSGSLMTIRGFVHLRAIGAVLCLGANTRQCQNRARISRVCGEKPLESGNLSENPMVPIGINHFTD